VQPLPRSVMATARLQHGLLTTHDLTAARVSTRHRSAALEAGLLSTTHRGVYRIASHPETFEQRCLAACLAVPHAVICGPTAGRLLGLRKVSTNDIHVLSQRTIHLVDVVAHRTNLLTELDVRQHGLCRVLRPARLVCDLAAYLDDDNLESVIEQMLERRLVQLLALRDVARQFVACGRNGSSRIARVLDKRPSWRRPVDSDLERRLLNGLTRAGLPVMTQYRLMLDSGREIILDLAQPEIRFGIEVDHTSWHGGRLESQRDKARDREAMRVGWQIARVTDDDIERRLAGTVDQLVTIAATIGYRR
jgi:very-short-patch-repair endonuclease